MAHLPGGVRRALFGIEKHNPPSPTEVSSLGLSLCELAPALDARTAHAARYPYRKQGFPPYCAFPLYDAFNTERCAAWDPKSDPHDNVCASSRRLPSSRSHPPPYINLTALYPRSVLPPPPTPGAGNGGGGGGGGGERGSNGGGIGVDGGGGGGGAGWRPSLRAFCEALPELRGDPAERPPGAVAALLDALFPAAM